MEYNCTWIFRFLDAYKTEGLQIWAVTTGNELIVPIFLPENVYTFPNKLGFPQHHRFWYKHYLGPTLRNSQHKNVKLITLDDQRIFANWWMDRVSISLHIRIHMFIVLINKQLFVTIYFLHIFMDLHIEISF